MAYFTLGMISFAIFSVSLIYRITSLEIKVSKLENKDATKD